MQLRGAVGEQSAEERPWKVPHPDTAAHRQQVTAGARQVYIHVNFKAVLFTSTPNIEGKILPDCVEIRRVCITRPLDGDSER